MFLSDKGEHAKDTVCCSAHNAGRKVREFVDAAAHDACEMTETVEKQIRENPVKASVLAAAAGFVLGVLFRRR